MTPTLGIIAGSGRLPGQLIEACRASGRKFFIVAFEQSRDFTPDAVVRIGAVGAALSHLRKAGVTELVLAGRVRRPTLANLKPDMTGLRLLMRLGISFFRGDDALLKEVVSFLEEEGFRVVGSEEILGDIVAPRGVLGKIQPGAQAMADIMQGLEAARALGRQDIGQAVIVAGGRLLGSEDAAGTDALIVRCGAAGGVLVKARKPAQESRVDLPAIGPQTVENCHRAGLIGIAIEAGGGIILDRERTIARADALGLFIVGV